MTALSSALFTRDDATKIFSAEASTLKGYGHDGGFYLTMRSEKTNEVAVFEHRYTHIHRHRGRGNGETLWWDYGPSHATLRRSPKLAGWKVRVHND